MNLKNVILVVVAAFGIVGFAYEHHLLVDSEQSFARERSVLQSEAVQLKSTIEQLQSEVSRLRETAQYHYQHGLDLLTSGNLGDAKQEFEEVITKYPTDPLAAEAKGRLVDVAAAVARIEAEEAAQRGHDEMPLFTAGDIGSAARANFGKFESDFQLKTVRLTGRVQDVGSTSFRMPSVSELYILVQDLPTPQLYELRTGDNVEVTGWYTGKVAPRRGFGFPSLIFDGIEVRKR